MPSKCGTINFINSHTRRALWGIGHHSKALLKSGENHTEYALSLTNRISNNFSKQAALATVKTEPMSMDATIGCSSDANVGLQHSHDTPGSTSTASDASSAATSISIKEEPISPPALSPLGFDIKNEFDDEEMRISSDNIESNEAGNSSIRKPFNECSCHIDANVNMEECVMKATAKSEAKTSRRITRNSKKMKCRASVEENTGNQEIATGETSYQSEDGPTMSNSQDGMPGGFDRSHIIKSVPIHREYHLNMLAEIERLEKCRDQKELELLIKREPKRPKIRLYRPYPLYGKNRNLTDLKGEELHAYLSNHLTGECSVPALVVCDKYPKTLPEIMPDLKKSMSYHLFTCKTSLVSAIELGVYLSHAFTLHRNSITSQKKDPWNKWVHDNIGLHANYASKLRKLAKILGPYKKFRQLNISTATILQLLNRIEEMLVAESIRKKWM